MQYTHNPNYWSGRKSGRAYKAFENEKDAITRTRKGNTASPDSEMVMSTGNDVPDINMKCAACEEQQELGMKPPMDEETFAMNGGQHFPGEESHDVLSIGDECGERGPMTREIDEDNPASGQPPLVWNAPGWLERKRQQRPSVGYAQVLLNQFLADYDGNGDVFVMGNAALDNIRAILPHRLKVDCWFGTNTEKATHLFQRAKGLQSDGKIGPHTWNELEGQGVSKPSKVCDFFNEPEETPFQKISFTEEGGDGGEAITCRTPTPCEKKCFEIFEECRKKSSNAQQCIAELNFCKNNCSLVKPKKKTPPPKLLSFDITNAIPVSALIVAPNSNSEKVVLVSRFKFDTRLKVSAAHKGKLIFRQYIMKIIRKEEGCGDPAVGIEKGPALDTKKVYNHKKGDDTTGVITLSGKNQKVEMKDEDVPLHSMSCDFNQHGFAKMFAHDQFRMLVIYVNEKGQETVLAHREWFWKGRGSFSKIGSTWTGDLSQEDQGIKGLSTPGNEPATNEVISGSNLMDGAKKVPFF